MRTSFPHLGSATWAIALVAAAVLPAKEVTVGTPKALAAALASAAPGDILTLGKGTWTDLHLKASRGGTPEKPLIIRAEAAGEVILNGTSTLVLNAPHVTVDGLFFYKGAIDGGSVIEFKSHHGILRNTAIVDYNPAEFETRYYWVFFSGDDNLVDRCYFKGKNHLEPLMGNAVEGSRRNSVANSYFKNIPHAEGNGREGIRVWGSGKFDATDADGAFFTIAHNLFEHADGEGVEIISLKSNYNRVVENTVIATRGCINIRQGSHNEIRGNIILGRSAPGAQGLRMSGLHNSVRGNYVAGCEFGIRVSTGEYIERALTPSYTPNVKAGAKKNSDGRIATYPQVKDLTLAGNVIVGTLGADLEMGFFYKRRWPESQMVLLPENCVIQGNRFVRPRGGVSIIGTVPETTPPLDQFRFAPNRYSGNRLVGGTNDYPPAAEGCVIEPLPAGWTEASEQAGFVPLTAADVGPAWVISLRAAQRFPMEDDKSCERPAAAAPPAKEKKARAK